MTPGPVLLPSNQFDHFYLGGDRIQALRGGPGGPRRPEEWLASTTTRAGEAPQGLSRLPDGSLLADAVAADPAAWLGPEHVARFGPGVELLVKLIDAGQRLPVHVHPTRGWAAEHLGLAHGKTEAWVIVDADPGAVVGLGLRAPLSSGDLLGLVRAHNSAALVDAVHTRPVRPGEGVFVPAGTPHFIGQGVLVVEVQEPTDLSILLEWEGFAVDGDRDGHLGVGFPTAVTAVDTRVWTPAEVDACVRALPGAATGLVPALVPDADPYFRADWFSGEVRLPAGFSVLVVLDGSGTVATEAGELVVGRGDVALVPFAAGAWSLRGALHGDPHRDVHGDVHGDGGGDLRGVLCRPPASDAPPAPR